MSLVPPPPEPTTRRIPLWRIAGTLLSVALLAYLVYEQGWDEFRQALSEVPLGSFLLALLLVMISRLFVTLRWHGLLRTAKIQVSFWQSLRLTFTGLFASNFLPSTVGGDLARLAGGVYLRMDAGVVTASLIVDRLIGMAGMALLLPLGLSALLRASGWTQPYALSGLAAWPGLKWLWNKLLGFLRSTAQSSIYWIKHPAGLGLGFLATFGHMFLTYLAVWVLLSGAGQPVPLLLIGGLWSLSYFVSLAPVSINGLGLQEVSIAYLYSHYAGVSMEGALALAVLLRIVFLLASLPGALFLPGILNSSRRKPKNEHGETSA
jgi:uncharacterized membrane protein YbhN (UPF0104 family)